MTRRSLRPLAVGAAVAAPVFVGVGYAAGASIGMWGVGAGDALDPRRFVRVLASPVTLESTLWTLRVAFISTLLSAVVAAALAIALRRADRVGRWGRALAVLPLPIPHLVAAVAALLILGQSGLLARVAFALGAISGPAEMPPLVFDRGGVGMTIALLWKEIPFLFLVAASVLATRGEALEEAARRLGASEWDVLRRVTWPTLWRGLLPASVAVFTFVVGSWEVAVLLAPSDPLALPLLTWERYIDSDLSRRPDAFVLALLGVSIAAVAVVAHELATRRPADTRGTAR
ncbi:MAG: ABC transporter permease subunit [Longimicrobiales bacterium]|nr:ABC transporter permease subunit [Longimicrobiales bacterium]